MRLKLTLDSKFVKSAKPAPLPKPPSNGSLPNASCCFFIAGGCVGRGGAGRGGGCLLFLGGKAGLGLEGRGGAGEELPTLSRVGACRTANGSQPNGSFSAYKISP